MSHWAGQLLTQPATVGAEKHYRNPIALAREWQAFLSTATYASRSELARELGVSRARVSQVLGLFERASEVVEDITAFG